MQQSNFTDRVIGGDFNLVMEPSIDRYQSLYNNKRSAQIVCEYLEQDYCDLWRDCNPDKRQYSWFRSQSRKGNRQCARLDFFLINQQL